MPLSIKVNLRVTGHCNQGGRKYMEDMFSVAYQQTSDDKDLEYAFFGIFDGHGGGEAAAFAKEHLMDIIVKQRNFWSDKDEDVLRAIRDGYVNTHYAMWRELDKWPRTASGLPSTAGTTASVAFIRKGKIYIGHVGDSGIILGYQDEGDPHWKAKALTKDHKPESLPEMMRIQESGGKVISKSGVPRVVWNRPRIGHKGPVRRSTHIDEIPFLAVARSLGDLWSYNSELDTFVVSPEPDVKVVTVDVKSHRCLIFGTDGLWNVLTPQAAVAIVQAAERHNEKHLIASQQTGNGPTDVQMWINPSKSLVDRALERWSSSRLRADNTSVVTLMLDPPGPSRSEVLMSRKNERVPSPKSVPVPPLCANASEPSPQEIASPLPRPKTSLVWRAKNSDTPEPVISPEAPCAKIDQIAPVCPKISETKTTPELKEDVKDDCKEIAENPENLVPPPSSTSGESIQVAEISSSNAADEASESNNSESKIDSAEISKDPEIENNNPKEETNVQSAESSSSKIDEKTPQSPTLVTNDVLPPEKDENHKEDEESAPSESLEVENQPGNALVRQKAFCGKFSCQDSKIRPRSRRTVGSVAEAADRSQESQDCVAVAGHPVIPSRIQSQGASLGSHLESRSVRRRRSVNTPTSCLGERQKSYFGAVGPRLKRDGSLGMARDRAIDARSTGSPSSAGRIPLVGSKRRHSSTSEPVEETSCGGSVQEPSAKRRTRSEDRPNLVDENEPANAVKQQQTPQQHSRLRWPEKSASSSRSRSGSISGSCGATNANISGNQDKISTPNSFQRRSLEKKATPVKTIRRPSINGSSRVQLRGSFALRDWDQTKSGHRGACAERSRLNRSVGAVIGSSPTDSSPAPSLQRWLRSDTLAATPVKTLRSRNVDITGHTVPAQIAHQYGVVKPNRLSLPAKLKLAGKVNKSASPTLASGKLPKQSPGSSVNVSTSNNTSSSAGITKRVKSPYNPSARSALGTRSRLKRLGK